MILLLSWSGRVCCELAKAMFFFFFFCQVENVCELIWINKMFDLYIASYMRLKV